MGYRVAKGLQNAQTISPAFASLILCALIIADSLNLFSLFESIQMLPFMMQLVLTVTSAIILEMAPNYCGAQFKYRTRGKFLIAVLLTVFFLLVSGLTALRITMMAKPQENVSDITFSQSSSVQTAEEETAAADNAADEENKADSADIAYVVFMTILLLSTSAFSFYLGYIQGDPVKSDYNNTVLLIEASKEEINSLEAYITTLEHYNREYLQDLDRQDLESMYHLLDALKSELKCRARVLLYENKDAKEISYISESAQPIAEISDESGL